MFKCGLHGKTSLVSYYVIIKYLTKLFVFINSELILN